MSFKRCLTTLALMSIVASSIAGEVVSSSNNSDLGSPEGNCSPDAPGGKQMSSSGGTNPINLFSGNQYEKIELLRLNTASSPIEIDLHYNSRVKDEKYGIYHGEWTNSYGQYAKLHRTYFTDNGEKNHLYFIEMVLEDGKRRYFAPNQSTPESSDDELTSRQHAQKFWGGDASSTDAPKYKTEVGVMWDRGQKFSEDLYPGEVNQWEDIYLYEDEAVNGTVDPLINVEYSVSCVEPEEGTGETRWICHYADISAIEYTRLDGRVERYEFASRLTDTSDQLEHLYESTTGTPSRTFYLGQGENVRVGLLTRIEFPNSDVHRLSYKAESVPSHIGPYLISRFGPYHDSPNFIGGNGSYKAAITDNYGNQVTLWNTTSAVTNAVKYGMGKFSDAGALIAVETSDGVWQLPNRHTHSNDEILDSGGVDRRYFVLNEILYRPNGSDNAQSKVRFFYPDWNEIYGQEVSGDTAVASLLVGMQYMDGTQQYVKNWLYDSEGKAYASFVGSGRILPSPSQTDEYRYLGFDSENVLPQVRPYSSYINDGYHDIRFVEMTEAGHRWKVVTPYNADGFSNTYFSKYNDQIYANESDKAGASHCAAGDASVTYTDILYKPSTYSWDQSLGASAPTNMKFISTIEKTEGAVSIGKTEYKWASANDRFGSPGYADQIRILDVIHGVGSSEEYTVKTRWYDLVKYLKSSVEYPDHKIVYDYYPDNRLKSVTVTAGTESRVWDYTYTLGVRAPHSDPYISSMTVDGPLSGSDDAIVYTYNGNGFLTRIENVAEGLSTTFSGHDSLGNPGSRTDWNGVYTELEYQPGTSKLTRMNYVGNGRDYTTTYFSGSYEVQSVAVNGKALYSAQRIDGSAYLTQYQTPGNTVNIKRNLLDGAPYSSTDSYVDEYQVLDAEGNAVQTSRTYYNGYGMPFMQEVVGSTISEFWYDSRGKIVKRADLNFGTNLSNVETDYTYNYLGHLDTMTRKVGLDPDNLYQTTTVTTDFTMDWKGRLTAVSVQSGNDTPVIVAEHKYNGFGEKTRELMSEIVSRYYTYTKAGKMETYLEGNAHTTGYQYDNVGRLTGVDYLLSGGVGDFDADVVYAYQSGKNRLDSIEDPSGVQAYQYDAFGNMTNLSRSLMLPDGSLLPALETAYSYNDFDQVTTITYPSGRIVTYGYDGYQRLDTVQRNGGALISGMIYGDASVLPNGSETGVSRVAKAALGNGLTQVQAWNGIGQLLENTTYNDANVLVGFEYGAYDQLGNPASITALPANDTTEYTYDQFNRLVNATQRNAQDSTIREYTYAYDATSNRQSRVIEASGQPTVTETYGYQSNTRYLLSLSGDYDTFPELETVSKSTEGGATTTRTFLFDDQGRLSVEQRHDNAIQNFEYGADRRLKSVDVNQ